MWSEVYIAFILISTVIFLTARSYALSKRKLKLIIDPEELTVIVPFRNEYKNLKRLVECLNDQTVIPSKVIFVNDHSNDEGIKVVADWCSLNEIGFVLQLEDGQFGKKKAIEIGVKQANSKNILTIDADTWFGSKFIESIVIDENVSMTCGPVILEPKGINQLFFSVEHMFFNSFNYLISPFYTLSASGANLLFNRESFIENNDLKKHEAISSGDDHFLLRNFQSNRLKIETINDPLRIVYTDAPSSFNAYLEQRIRWFGKTLKKTDLKEALFGLYITIYLIAGFGICLFSLFQAEYESIITIFLTRFILDSLILLIYGFRMGKGKYIFMLPFFQLIYPVVYIVIIIGSLVYTPTWKGRKI